MRTAPLGPEADRLPWLNDTPTPARESGWAGALLLLLLGAIALAALSYSVGRRADSESHPATVPRAVTVDLPRSVSSAQQPAKPMFEAPRVRLEPDPITRPAPRRVSEERARPQPVPRRELVNARSQGAPARPAMPRPKAMPLWPAAHSEGAAGRVARIGTFATRRQAKIAWARVMRVYPGMTRLRAVVAPLPSLRNGRTYYRLQFGTTSQAHSEVLCQRMRMVGQSCVVVGV